MEKFIIVHFTGNELYCSECIYPIEYSSMLNLQNDFRIALKKAKDNNIIDFNFANHEFHVEKDDSFDFFELNDWFYSYTP